MVTAQELIVAIRSEGVQDANDDLNQMEESFTATSEQAGDTSENLEGFTESIQGALSAAVAGLAIATAGLASQIPVLGEVAAGLGAIFSALGLQVDQLLRDLGIGGLTGGLFTVASGISQAEGATADLIGVIGGLVTIVSGAAASVVSWSLATNGLIGTLSLAKGAIVTAGQATASFVAGISAITAGVVAVGAAVFGFFAAYALGLGNIRRKTDNFANGVEAKFEASLRSIRQTLIGIKEGLKKRFSSAINTVASAVESMNDSIASSLETAESNLRDFLLGVRQALLGVKEDIVGFFSDIGSTIKDSLPEVNVGNNGGLDFDLGNETSNQTDRGRDNTTGSSPSTGRTGTANGPTIDGRVLIESTGRQRRDIVARNGTGL